jgi:spermidine/putrescine transport system permease protein
MRLYAIAVYFFLYVPIGIIVLFSFNSGRHASDFQGLSLKWYGKALSNPFVMEALTTSLIIALSAAILSSIMGTTAALALQRMRGPMRVLFDGLIYVSIMIPGIVIGIATLIALVTVFDLLNPLLAALWPEDAKPPKLALGYPSVIAAHTLFTMSLVIVLVRARIAGMDRTLIEASEDNTMGNIPPDYPAADLSGNSRRISAELHIQLRRFHHLVFCCRA